VSAAKLVARRIGEGKLHDHFSARELYKKGWSGISSHQEAEKALRVLEETGYVHSYEAISEGRTTTRYQINPLLGRPV